ncbi:MAG: hypothetical protein WC180_03085 [Candidatus Paceibacterota bacterium]
MKFNYSIIIKTLAIAAILGIPYLIFVGHMTPFKAVCGALPAILTVGLAWMIWKTETTLKRL